MHRSPTRVVVGIVVAAAVAFLAGPAGTRTAGRASAAGVCPAPGAPMTFGPPTYVDPQRAGGEPMVATHPDGSLLLGTHAGTTHFFTPAAVNPTSTAFAQHYTGQTYDYWSNDLGRTWHFVPRSNIPDNVMGSGFSDPDFAIDTAGQVFISEINLVNVAMSRSTDRGRSYHLRDLFAQSITDREWTEADQKNIVYEVGNEQATGHTLYKSTDGGATWSAPVSDSKGGDGLGDLRVDKTDGTLYEAHYDGKTLSMAAFRKARHGVLTPETTTVATGVSMLSHWPSFDVDREGNLAITWDESGTGTAKRAAGVYYAYSRDRGHTWSAPVRVDVDGHTAIWPWLAVGEPGHVAVAWFQADKALPNADAQTPGTYGWRVLAAQTTTGLGCPMSAVPGFAVVPVTSQPFHTGTICQGGTVCQAEVIDRRLGDYFSIAIDGTGHLWSVYSDTRRGGAVSLAAFVRQTGGPTFGPPANVAVGATGR